MGRPHWIAAALCIIGLGGCGDAALFSEDRSNLSADIQVVTAADVGPVSLGQVLSSFDQWSADEPAPAFVRYPMPDHCRMPRASGQAKVYYYYTYGGGQNTPVQMTYPEQAKRAAAAGYPVSPERIHRTDILVTDTEAPVYLVLASYDAMLWNIQLAPGARVDGVSVMSYEGAMVANAPDARRVGFTSMRDSPNAKCRLKPRGPGAPVEARIASARRLNPDFDPSSHIDQWKEDYRLAQKFHRQDLRAMVGSSADVQLYRSQGVGSEAVLAGPVPAQPFAAQPVTSILYQSNLQPWWGRWQDVKATLNPGS